MATIKIPHKLRNELWWLIISVDFDYSRIAIADHEINGDHITFWLEQTWAREAMLKTILTQLIETEVHAGNI